VEIKEDVLMSVLRVLHSIGLLLLVACTSKEGVAVDNPLRAELEMLTGSNARECGFVALDQDPATAWECAKDADKQDVPYWIAIERSGIDSDVWIAGLRVPSGVRYVLMYDSNYMGGPGLLPRFSREACMGQLVLDMKRQKVIQCLRSSKPPH
jgi:hypothetical protein